jgi:hypothetical protein
MAAVFTVLLVLVCAALLVEPTTRVSGDLMTIGMGLAGLAAALRGHVDRHAARAPEEVPDHGHGR